MTNKTKPFKAEKYFDTPEAQARLLTDALAEGDAGYIAAAIGVIARAHGMSALANESGLSRPALYEGLSEKGNPSLDTVIRVLRVLGLSLEAKAVVHAPELADA